MSGRSRRGISPGSVCALTLTALVVVSLLVVLPKLGGNVRIQSNPAEAILTANGMPGMEIREIPLQPAGTPEDTEAPAMTQAPVAQAGTPSVTAAPAAASAVSPTPGRTQAVFSPTPAPTETRTRGRTATLLFGGTVAMEDPVRQSGYYQEAKAYDFSEIFSGLRSEITGDLRFVTLENLTHDGKKMSDLNAPEQVMKMLSGAGFDTVALGFPKAYQFGADGVSRTLGAAGKAGLRAVGLYGNEEDSHPEVTEIGGIRTALLHYTDSVDSTGKKLLKKSGDTWALPLAEQASAEIKAAREAGAELVIVSVRWGSNGKTKLTSAQKKLAQSFADTGADVIIGTGSRRVQEIEYLTASRPDGSQARTLCAWSLGSLLEESRSNGAVEGVLLRVAVRAVEGGAVSVEKAETVPTFTWRFSMEGASRYRVIPADRLVPDGMNVDSASAMAKALQRLQKTLSGGAAPLR